LGARSGSVCIGSLK
jgi:hypothetical protein